LVFTFIIKIYKEFKFQFGEKVHFIIEFSPNYKLILISNQLTQNLCYGAKTNAIEKANSCIDYPAIVKGYQEAKILRFYLKGSVVRCQR